MARLRSLASRLVLLVVLQFVLFIATAVAIFVAQGPRDEAHPRDVISPAVMVRIEASLGVSSELQARLDELRRKRIEVTLYDAQRRMVASNVDPPLAIPERRRRPPPPPYARPEPPGPFEAASGPPRDLPPPGTAAGPAPRTEAGPGAPRSLVMGVWMRGERGLLVARGVHGKPPGIGGPILSVVAGLLILVIGALLTARWIVRPLERLSRTARALGAGDLRARSRLARRDEIGELGRRIDEMADRIEGLLVSEKELLANVAHELRTPLTRIGVALDLAGEGDAEAARASLAEIAVDVSELESIVDDILTAMRFEIAAGGAQLPLRRAVTEPAAIATAAGERMRLRHATRPFTVEVAGELAAVHVDPMLFRRVIDNLLDNAHKYSPDPDAPIALVVEAAGDHVAFSVRDRGIGITADDLPRVFTPFFRGDRSRSREAGGVGLGLTLARRIVEAHGGDIAIDSTAGRGTTVRVTVPAVT